MGTCPEEGQEDPAEKKTERRSCNVERDKSGGAGVAFAQAGGLVWHLKERFGGALCNRNQALIKDFTERVKDV